MRIVFSLVLILCNFTLSSQQSGFILIENKGQWHRDVLFKTDLKNGHLYTTKSGFVYDFYDEKKLSDFYENHYNNLHLSKNKKLKKHAYRVQFKNSDFSTVIKNQPTKHTFNYFKGNKNSWKSNVKGYHQITYKNVYPEIDIQLYTKLIHLKYDLIVKPGGDPYQIKLFYEGIDDISIKRERLHIYTSVNHVIEDKPYAYQLINGEKKEIVCHYKLHEHTLSFEFPLGYDKNHELIIDPTLIFSTFSGSYSNNFGYTATFDSDGFLYSGSSVFGSQYPTTLGAYNINFMGGDVDIGLSKFDTTGSFLIYSTYLGGSSEELPHSIIVNNMDELFILGTTSSNDFPTTTNSYDTSFNGGTPLDMSNGLGINYINGSDIFVSKISADGANLMGSTYIGGSGNDGLNRTSATASDDTLRYNYADEIRGEIEIDQNNNIYVGTCTQSTDFPTTNNSFQGNFGGGSLDGCLFKLDNKLQNLVWSTYIGGERFDAVYSIALNDSLDVTVSGGTNSLQFPTTASAIQPNFQGGRCDGFVSEIKHNGNQLLHSTYYGSNEYDQVYFVDLDRNQNKYVFGQTEKQDSSFINNALWSIPGSGQFVSKFTFDLSNRIYSTVFGSGNGINISPTAFLVDLCNKMYLAGWGGTVNQFPTYANNAGFTNNMPISSDAFQSTTDSSDFYIMVLEDDASGLVYGSYFGGSSSSEHVDGGTSRFDRKGKIYQAVCAGCGNNSDLPIYPTNVVSATNNSSCNLGVFKMEFDLPFVLADFETPPIGCEPQTHQFNNTSVHNNSSIFNWDFGDGSSSNLENPSHTFQQAGTYDVQLVISDTAACNFSDTVVKQIIVIGDTSYHIGNVDLCLGESIQIGIIPNPDTSFTYQWIPPQFLSDSSVSNPFANPVSSTTYSLLISNGVCTDTATQQINIINPTATIPNSYTLCDYDDIINLSASNLDPNSQIIWSTSSLFLDTLNNANASSISVSPNQDTWYYIKVNIGNCNFIDSTLVNVSIGSLQIIGDSILCYGDSMLIIAETFQHPDSVNFTFSPDSITLSNFQNDSVWFMFTENNTIFVTVSDPISGCTLSDSIYISVDSLPYLNLITSCSFPIISAGGSSQLNVTPNGYQYSWQPSGTLDNPSVQNPIASPVISTWYTVNVNSNTCTKSDSILIEVFELTCGPPDVFVPNSFSPNNDQNNDVFRVRGNYVSESNFILRIFDRLGNLVFESNDQSVGWDGFYKDRACDPGVFVYYLELDCLDGQRYFKKGNVTLLK